MVDLNDKLKAVSAKKNNNGFSRITTEVPDAVRKWGDGFRLSREAEAMNYVHGRTSIPVPKVVDVFIDENSESSTSWLLMERLPGVQLGAAWPGMSEQARSETIRQLKSYFEQLHQLRPDGAGWIGSCSRGPAYDHRLTNLTTCGPFASVSEFHDFLVAPVKLCPQPEWASRYRGSFPDTHVILFAHADISGENILIDPVAGDVTGILDWEMAGFWPAWWEYRKALFGARSQLWWIEILNQIMPQYPTETDADMDVEMF
ncbi:hypothetical protein ACHAQA_005596 [Verticillium albo-atrum]